jgi:ribosome biogenesis GTPase A
VGFKLAFTGAIKDEVLDIDTVALRLTEYLGNTYPDMLKGRYKLTDLDEEPLKNLDTIAMKRGCIFSGGRIDYSRVANIILDEFRSGKIGYITLEKPEDFKDTSIE